MPFAVCSTCLKADDEATSILASRIVDAEERLDAAKTLLKYIAEHNVWASYTFYPRRSIETAAIHEEYGGEEKEHEGLGYWDELGEEYWQNNGDEDENESEASSEFYRLDWIYYFQENLKESEDSLDLRDWTCCVFCELDGRLHRLDWLIALGETAMGERRPHGQYPGEYAVFLDNLLDDVEYSLELFEVTGDELRM